jgi:hypothetical protein
MWKCATAREQDEQQEKHKNFLQQKCLKSKYSAHKLILFFGNEQNAKSFTLWNSIFAFGI